MPEAQISRVLTPGQKGYLAGVLDGEGWLGITTRKPKWKTDPNQPHYHRPAMTISQCNKNKVLLDYIATMLGEGDFGYARETNVWTLRFHTPCMRWVLPQLMDVLILKRRQAEILLEFATACTYHGKALTQEQWDHREALRLEIKRLNEKLGPKGVRLRH